MDPDRVSFEDDLGTIRYIGTLPEWGPNVKVLGIEWDRPERGKNNGDINGVTYFQPIICNSGSFIKSSNKKIGPRNDFISAVQDKYHSDTTFRKDLKFGTKTVESYGFSKLNEIQSNFRNLKSLSLQRTNIVSINRNDDTKNIMESLENVEHLDLSFNLFNNFQQVGEIIGYLPNLKSLVLNGNRFFGGFTISQHNLKILKLSATNIEPENLQQILNDFPNLDELYLAGNNYNNLEINSNLLKLLDLSFNNFLHIPPWLLRSQTLNVNLSDNHISTIPHIVSNISILDLRRNQIKSWDTIDQIYLSFPHLAELRINDNPLFDSLSIEEMTINLIARLKCQGSKEKPLPNTLKKLNGSLLKTDEIINAELYFISKVKQNVYYIDRDGRRWRELLEKFNMDPALAVVQANVNKKLNLILHHNVKKPRVFLKDNSILRLKGIVSKTMLNNASILHFKLYYYVNEFEPDTTIKIKQFLDDDLSKLGNYGFLDNQTIFVEMGQQ